MRILFVFFLVVALFLGLHLNAQQPNISPNKRITKANFVVGKTYVVDTIIQGKTYYKEYVSSSTALNRPELPTNVDKAVRITHTPEYKATDSTNTKALSDLKVASELDKKWLETLYSHTLFDTIYNAVSQLKYTNVEYKSLSTDTLKARLKALDAKTPFHIVYNPELENVIKRYLKYRSKSYEKLIGLSHFYFPMFEQTFDAYNIPLEMKYLAIVESALQPKAQSHAGATGLWQFMYTTGKMYNLEVNSYIDERSDPVLATTAAAQFLSKLYKIYGDWDLTLAAYNSGPGNVNKAIRRSGGYKNYWNIRQHLPKETAGYVPAFLATLYIFEYAEQHGIRPQKPSFQHIETDTVHVRQMLSLDHVAELTNTNIEALQFLNPQYKHDIIPKVKNKTYILRLPRSATGVFVANETKVYAFAKAEFEKREQPLPQFFKAESQTRYRVKSGDYLGKIARQFGVRVSQIKRWNGLRSNNLKIGQRLTVYPRKPITATKTQPQKKSINTTGKTTYVVKEGDSLWSIAQKFSGVSVENIKDWNDISGTKLNIGSTLIVSE